MKIYQIISIFAIICLFTTVTFAQAPATGNASLDSLVAQTGAMVDMSSAIPIVTIDASVPANNKAFFQFGNAQKAKSGYGTEDTGNYNKFTYIVVATDAVSPTNGKTGIQSITATDAGASYWLGDIGTDYIGWYNAGSNSDTAEFNGKLGDESEYDDNTEIGNDSIPNLQDIFGGN